MSAYVLVADAEPDLIVRARGALRGSSLVLRVARDGIAARDAFREHGLPALLVMNLALPKLDGFEVLKDLRSRDPSATVPVVAASTIPSLLRAAEAISSSDRSLRVCEKSMLAAVVEPLIVELSKGSGHGDRASKPSFSSAASPVTGATSLVATSRRSEADERARLAHIEAMGIVDDAPPDAALQDIVAKVARQLDVPVALISVVLEDRQWFKAYAGLSGKLLEERSTPRSWSFCHHVVEGQAPMVITDARAHPVFADNPLVRSGVVGGYAGAPLTMGNGEVVGTLCVIDQKPLVLDRQQLQRLKMAARRVAGELETRSLQRTKQRALAGVEQLEPSIAFGYLEAAFDALDIGVVVSNAQRRMVIVNRAAERFFGVASRDLIGRTRDEMVNLLARSYVKIDENDTMSILEDGPWVVHEDIELALPERRIVRCVGKPFLLPDGLGHISTLTDIS